MKYLKLLLLTAFQVGCDWGTESNQAVMNIAQSWAEAYFNCDYHDAEQYITTESQKWLRFAASNTTEQDLQLLQAHDVTIETTDDTVCNDTLHVVTLQVSNYLAPTALGDSVAIASQGVFQVTVVKRDGQWQVRMEGLPRSEKQSRD